MLCLLSVSSFIDKSSALDLMYSKAIVADSFITLPKLPVIDKLPFPFESADSINKISPPN